MDIPESRYARRGEAYVPYQRIGSGRLDIVLPIDAGMALELIWDEPGVARFFRRLGEFARVVLVQSRAWSSLRADHTLENHVADLVAVLDDIDCEEAAIFAAADAGLSGVFMAATYPTRTRALVLFNAYARLFRDERYPFGLPMTLRARLVAAVKDGWGTGNSVDLLAPSRAGDERFRRWSARSQRVRAAPNEAAEAFDMWIQGDVSRVLDAVQVPTLVLHRVGDQIVRPEHGRYLAAHIRGSKYVELPGDDHLFAVGDVDGLIGEIEEFLTGARRVAISNRVLATVVFTDIVRSTDHAARHGDRLWQETLADHDETIRAELERFSGREVNTTGDGFVVVFDGPSRAIRCATAIHTGLQRLGIQIRVGIHTGEIEARGDEIAGIAVHLAQRVQTLAEPGETLVSSTVKDLTGGSGISFADRGIHSLKGIPDAWQLYAVDT